MEILPPLHADPSDRVLVAQALAESMRLLTREVIVAAYGAMVMVVCCGQAIASSSLNFWYEPEQFSAGKLSVSGQGLPARQRRRS
jgi:hypothetical protein